MIVGVDAVLVAVDAVVVAVAAVMVVSLRSPQQPLLQVGPPYRRCSPKGMLLGGGVCWKIGALLLLHGHGLHKGSTCLGEATDAAQ